MSLPVKKRLSTVPEEPTSQEKMERVILKLKVLSRSGKPETLAALLSCLTHYKKQNEEIGRLAPAFDPLTGLEANGFRSFLKISDALASKVDEEMLKMEQEGECSSLG